MQPYGAFTLFFRWRKKSVQKKASGTATTKTAHVAARRGLRPAVAPSGLSSASARCAHPPEKGFYCPFCRRGSQCRAQWSWIAITYVWSALVLAFFRRQNGRAFFPPLPIAALLPRRWRWADSKESQLGCYGVTWLVLQQKNRLVFFTTVGTMPTQSASLGMLRRGLDIPVTQKASGILYPRWSLLRAMRPVAEWRPFLFNKQGNHTRPASREARRRAAVKPRPNRISLYAPARPWRAVRGCRGSPPAIR